MVTDVTVTLGTEPGPVGQVRVMRRDAPGCAWLCVEIVDVDQVPAALERWKGSA